MGGGGGGGGCSTVFFIVEGGAINSLVVSVVFAVRYVLFLHL